MAEASTVLDELIDPLSRCLTPEVARQIAELRAPASVQGRIEELAVKSTEGTLSEDERAEYDAYVAAGNFISILQSKARALLREQSGP